MPAWQALVPALVPREELPSAIALNSAQFNVARLLGPMVAGALLTAAGAAAVFDVNVLSFLAIVVVLALVRVPAQPLREAPTRAGVLRKQGGVREALSWTLRQAGPRRILLGLLMFALLAAPVQGLLPVYADQLLHVGAQGYGALLACLGAGAIAGALTLARLPPTYPRHHLIPLSMLGFALCAMLYASSSSFALSGFALTVGGVFWVWSLASSNTAMQLLVPDRLRGRAMSVLALANTGALPLGHLLAARWRTGTARARRRSSPRPGWPASRCGRPGRPSPPSTPWRGPSRPARRPARRRLGAFTAASHRAQEVDPSSPRGGAEPVEE